MNEKKSNSEYYTIPELAKRLGVSSTAVRVWIKRQMIPVEPVVVRHTGQRVFTATAAERLEEWYMKRCACGATAGYGAAARRERARAWLATQPEEVWLR